MSARALAAALAALALLAGAAAAAYVPPADRVARTVADANRAHGRSRALALTVVVRGAEGEAPLATGTLLSDPRGAARLELAHASGFRERQLRRGTGLEASRDGAPLPDPHPLLAPLWLLQADLGPTLQTRIAELGGDPDAISLGFDGEHDCYVLGGRTGASYWVDQESLDPVRIELPGGVRYRLGPMRTQAGVRLPAWITLEVPGRPSVTLGIESARPEAPAPDAFSTDWLAR